MTTSAAGTSVEIVFDLERETKGAVRYNERLYNSMDEPISGAFYIRKTALRKMGFVDVPKIITMTLKI